MKITSVEFHPEGSSAICELSFRDPTRQNPYNVKGITGLDADEIVARSYGPGSSGFRELIMVQRDISALVELNPNFAAGQSHASLRDDLFRMIATSRKGLIEVWFKNGEDVVATVSGTVKKMEASLFVQNPEAQITIECDEPELKAPDPVSVSVVGLDPTLTIIDDTLSTKMHGFKFQVTYESAEAAFVMSDPDDPEWSFEVTPVGGFFSGDVLWFSSEYNNKYIYLVRAGSTIHLADVVSAGSVWPIMFPGENKFSIADGPSLDWTSISYYPTYWGV